MLHICSEFRERQKKHTIRTQTAQTQNTHTHTHPLQRSGTNTSLHLAPAHQRAISKSFHTTGASPKRHVHTKITPPFSRRCRRCHRLNIAHIPCAFSFVCCRPCEMRVFCVRVRVRVCGCSNCERERKKQRGVIHEQKTPRTSVCWCSCRCSRRRVSMCATGTRDTRDALEQSELTHTHTHTRTHIFTTLTIFGVMSCPRLRAGLECARARDLRCGWTWLLWAPSRVEVTTETEALWPSTTTIYKSRKPG